MLMHDRVARAFCGAGTAKGDAGRELRFLQLPMPCLVGAGHDMSRCGTDRCAIEIEANAVDQLLDMLFGKARIGAGRAGFHARKTGIDTEADGVGLTDMLRMRMEQGANRGHRAVL